MSVNCNRLRILTGILCIAVTVFIFTSFANADDEVQYKSYDLKGYSGSVEVDQSVRDKIQDKAIKEIAGETYINRAITELLIQQEYIREREKENWGWDRDVADFSNQGSCILNCNENA